MADARGRPLAGIAGDLEALERRGWEALSSAHGARFYEDLMSEDGLMVFPGLVLDKAATVRAIAAERPWSTFTLAEVRVLELAPDAALVTYRSESQREGQDTYRALMTTIYARRDGRWRLVLHQQSPEPRAA